MDVPSVVADRDRLVWRARGDEAPRHAARLHPAGVTALAALIRRSGDEGLAKCHVTG